MGEGEERAMSAYVELHAGSAFSFLRGATAPEALVQEALRLGLPGVALLDRDGVYGAPRFYKEAFQQPLRAIVGAELTMEDGSVLPLLVMNQAGYRNLSRLICTAKMEARPAEVGGRIATAAGEGGEVFIDARERKRPCYATWRELAEHADGLVALTGDEEGPVLRAWARGGAAAVAAEMGRLEGIFPGERLQVEVQRRRVRGEETAVRMLRDLAAARGRPLLATGGVRYATRGERRVADVFACLRNHTTLDEAGRRLAPNGERHLRSAAEMRELFRDLPEALTASGRLAERLEFTLKNLGYAFPDFPVGEGETQLGVLRERVYAGARWRYGGVTARVTAQIEKELTLIAELGFEGYFLIVWDICRWTKEQGILIQGRGSAANSVVCYALGITAVDPIKNQLLFERFLSRGRIGPDGHPSWPDVDLDLPSGELREAVIQKIYEQYAPRGAAMVANVITYRGRSTMREVGKVLGFSPEMLDRFSALYGNGDFPHTLEAAEQMRLAGMATHPRLPALLGLYHAIKGLPRHLGQHSGGMILCPGRLDAVVPIEPASMERRCVVQWDKDDCEDLGLVKIDFLGLGMMAVLQESLKFCADSDGPKTIEQIVATDDPATYDSMCRADTIGVFQIESRAQMATLPRFRPKNLYDVAMQVAIVRPGPIVGKLVHPLIRRRQGLEEVDYIDASVEQLVRPILERTKGVILFQEQMLKIAMDVGGFDASQAEELRRAMGFTRGEERLRRSLAKLRESMRRRGIKDIVADKVAQSCESFAAYGFPESHAMSFALLAYASTWLKVHRPAEFCASLLNNQPMGFYSPATLIQDARRHGLKVRPVCVAASRWECTVEDGAMRIGLSYVKGLHETRARAMLAARAERPWASMTDFLARTHFTAGERRALATVGALHALAPHRRAALWQVEAAWAVEEDLLRGVEEQAATDEASGAGARAGTPLAAMTAAERWRADFGGLGLTVGEHPMKLVRAQLPGVWCANELVLGQDGERLTIGGSVICRQRPGTAKGVVFISLEDETGVANAIVRAELYERLRLTINEEAALRIGGRLQKTPEGVIHVRAETIEALRLDELPAQASHDFH